jgi:hypothetical protein
LNEIADDPDYLAEWQQRSDEKSEPPPNAPSAAASVFIDPQPAVEPRAIEVIYPAREDGKPDAAPEPVLPEIAYLEPELERQRMPIRIVTAESAAPPAVLHSSGQAMNDRSAADILYSHVGMGEDEWGFLPCLRRGEPVPPAKVAELEGALVRIEDELRGSESLDRRIAHSLHRLALESQVLLTDAWPGVFDEVVIQAIRTVQEAVERILSGQDIRYYSSAQPARERSL